MVKVGQEVLEAREDLLTHGQLLHHIQEQMTMVARRLYGRQNTIQILEVSPVHRESLDKMEEQ